MKSIFGWSYPPGCSGPPDENYYCEVCGQHMDDCICPECPVCGEIGNPDCYEDIKKIYPIENHGLRRNAKQVVYHLFALYQEKLNAEEEDKMITAMEEEEKRWLSKWAHEVVDPTEPHAPYGYCKLCGGILTDKEYEKWEHYCCSDHMELDIEGD